VGWNFIFGGRRYRSDLWAGSGHGRSGNSVDVDGGRGDCSADGFSGGHKTYGAIFSGAFGLIKRVIGEDDGLVVRDELGFRFLPREHSPTNGAGDAQIDFAAFHTVGPVSDGNHDAIGENVGFFAIGVAR